MFGTRHRTTGHDMQSLVKEAQLLVRETSAYTGDQADILRHKGLKLLEAGIVRAQAIDESARASGKAIARRTNDVVQANHRRLLTYSQARVAKCGHKFGDREPGAR